MVVRCYLFESTAAMVCHEEPPWSGTLSPWQHLTHLNVGILCACIIIIVIFAKSGNSCPVIIVCSTSVKWLLIAKNVVKYFLDIVPYNNILCIPFWKQIARIVIVIMLAVSIMSCRC